MIYYASIDDYLYILLGIGWVLFSIYTNNKKKAKKKQTTTDSEKSSPSFLDSLFNEIGLKEESGDPYEHIEKPSVDTSFISSVNMPMPVESKIISHDDFYEVSNFDKDKDVLKSETVIENSVKPAFAIDRKVKNKRRNTKKVDIRKAVIYSEILSKKYF